MTKRTKCEICNREFKDAEGLAAHSKAKHPELIGKPKKQLLGKIDILEEYDEIRIRNFIGGR